MILPAIGIIAELAIRMPLEVLRVAGSSWLVKGIHGPCSKNRQIMTAFANVLNYWLDDPTVRHRGRLQQVVQVAFDHREFESELTSNVF